MELLDQLSQYASVERKDGEPDQEWTKRKKWGGGTSKKNKGEGRGNNREGSKDHPSHNAMHPIVAP